MIQSKHKLIILTPIYEDLAASTRLFAEIKSQFKNNVFVIAVDDGSLNEPIEISSFKNIKLDGAIIKLKRNVGHQKAIAVGLAYVADKITAEQIVVVMDSDGEDLPSTISDLVNVVKDSEIDVAVAQRKSRVESLKFKLFYAIYKQFFSLMTGRSISFGNFMALKQNAVQRLVVMQELSIHVAGAVIASKLRTRTCAIHRGQRYAGHSKMNFVGLALHGFKALMVFAEDVLVRVGITCGLIAGLSLFAVISAVILKMSDFATPGWFSVVLGILILMLMQTGALALMTLMLTGVIRSGTVTTVISYHDLILEVFLSSSKKSSDAQ
jgi:glycosyltransferase involved in cell wall biosynthesis